MKFLKKLVQLLYTFNYGQVQDWASDVKNQSSTLFFLTVTMNQHYTLCQPVAW